MKKDKISDAVIRRLPRYYRHLDDLHQKGSDRISSGTLGGKMGITPSQIRQDFSCFGEFGQQGFGYKVEGLRNEIGHILGVDLQHRIIVIGAGNLGRALIRNFRFNDCGFTLEAAFDISPNLAGTELDGVPVLSMDTLEDFVRERKPDVAVLTVPQAAAQEMASRLAGLDIQGIWNFTNVELDVPGVCLEDVHFADSLLTLSYHVTEQRRKSDR